MRQESSPQKKNEKGIAAAAHRLGSNLVSEVLHKLVLLLGFGKQAAKLVSHFSLEAQDQTLVVPSIFQRVAECDGHLGPRAGDIVRQNYTRWIFYREEAKTVKPRKNVPTTHAPLLPLLVLTSVVKRNSYT